IAAVDEPRHRIFFTSTETSPIERQLWSVSFDGANKRRVTKGEGWHSVSVSPTGAYVMDDYSSIASPLSSTLLAGDGTEVRAWSKADLSAGDDYEVLPTEILSVKAADGTPLYARLIKPAGFKPGVRYPAVVIVYGGPDIQQVHNA